MKSFKMMNGYLKTLLGSALILGLFLINSCDKKDDPDTQKYSFPGVYTFAKAEMVTQFEIPIPGGTSIPVPAGTNVTPQIAGALLAAAQCTNPANGAVDLKENNQLFYTCIGESKELQAGTWAANDAQTELIMNLSVPAAMALKITSLTIDRTANVVKGTITNFPLTPELIEGFLTSPGMTQEQKDAIIAGLDPVYLVDIKIEFQKLTL